MNDAVATGDTLSVVAVDTTGTIGTVQLSATAPNGVYYNPGTAFAYLSEGETATDTFSYTVSDGEGGTSTATVTVTIEGVNQAPVAHADTAATAANTAVSIAPLANDTDANRDDTLSVTALNTTGTKGSVALGPNNTVVYTPGAAFAYLKAGTTATDSFVYTVSDNHGATATATDTVTITGTWAAPTAQADTAATTAKSAVTIAVLANDSDANPNDPLTVSAVSTQGTKGTVSINADGTVTYNPGTAFLSLKAGAVATDSFGYTVTDAHGVSSTSTVTVTVTGVNTPPVAAPDTAATMANTPVWITLTANDTDVNNDTLNVTAVNTAGTKGTVTLNAAAPVGVAYSPGTAFAYLSAGETATDSFTYTVSDGHGGTATATATVTITGVNQAPVAKADTAATAANAAVTITPLANDTDVNRDDTLSVTALNTANTKGSVALGPNNTLVYTPGAAFAYLKAGTTATDSFTYTVSDNHGATATATDTVTVTGTWAAPTAQADTAATDAKTAVAIAVLANDSDANPNDPLTVSALNTTGTKGSVSINANGTVTYNPGTAFLGLAAGAVATDSFGYTVTDAHGVSSTSTVSVTVTGVNTPPVAVADTATTAANTAIWLNLTGNDTDVNHDTLSVVSLNTTGTKGTVSLNATAPNGAAYNPGTAFAYLSAGETATDSFTYTVSDGHGGTATATATVTITGVNQAPVAKADTATTNANVPVKLMPLANDTDVNRDDTLSVTALNTTGTKGTVLLSGNTVVYTPGASFKYLAAGTTATDSFSYTVSDNHGATATATDTVTINGTWAAPVAPAETAATTAKSPVTIAVLASDSDPNAGDPISITGLNVQGTKGTLSLNANGTVTYNPGTAFLGLAAGAVATDSFGYTVTDAHGVSSTNTVTVTITGVNTPPVAVADTATTAANAGIWLNLTGNDTDVNHDTLSVVSLNTTGTKGTVSLNATAPNGAEYSPGTAFAYLSAGETATDSFTYTVSDGHGGTATATATVTVTGVNQAPVAKADTATTNANAAVTLTPLANDTDVNRDDTLSITALNTAGTKGSVSLSGNTVVYTPGAAFQYLQVGSTATDSFAYTVSDNHGATATATDTVTIDGTWKPPTASAVTAVANASTPLTLNLLASAADVEPGQTLTISSLNLQGTDGSAVINPNGTVTYTPGAAYAGLAPGSSSTDQFTYTVSDGHGGTATATVNLTVLAAGSTSSTGAAASPGSASSLPSAIYVSPNGNDAWSGKLAGANATGTDGPLATLQAAQKVMEANPSIKTVYIEGGTYSLSQSLTLTAADSGESWLAMPGQTPVIQGGQTITGWTQGANGIWTAQAPAGAFPNGGASGDLFLNGVRQTEARYPDAAPSNPVQGGWLNAAASLPGQNTTNSFQFNPGDIPTMSSTSGLMVAIYSQNGWDEYNVPVSSINYQTDTVTLANSVGVLGEGSRYFLYDSASMLNAPGEWYYNQSNNTVSYDAPAGFNGSGVTVGSLSQIVTLNGASNVTMAGLTITGSSNTGDAIYANNASGLLLAGDTINNVGNGVVFASNGSNDTIEGSTIENTDDNGILIYPGTSNVTIQGNSIHDIGQLVNGDAIYYTGSSNDYIANNTIANVARAGVAGGSTVGLSDASYNDVITANQFTNTNTATSDGGAIDIAGAQLTPTNDLITNNTIYGTTAAGTAATPQLTFESPSQLVSFGIYLDDYASGVTVSGNYLDNNVGGIIIHSGSNDTIENNTLLNTSSIGLDYQLSNWRNLTSTAPSGNIFQNNLVSNNAPGAVLAQVVGDPSNVKFSGNFYNAAGIGNASFISDTSANVYTQGNLATWQALGYDTNSLSGNPLVNAAGTALGAGSAALALGLSNPLVPNAGVGSYVAQNQYEIYGR